MELKYMKALILAAGMGSRLLPITESIPKSLVSVNGKPILLKQIENLRMNGIKDITIVSGYKANILKQVVHDIYPEIHIVESTSFATTNNMYSAWIGLKQMFMNGNIEPFIMMNADVFFDSNVLQSLLIDPSSDAIVVDIGRYNEESMKVMEKDGRLIMISKQISSEKALGSSIDVYKFSDVGGSAFYESCSRFIEEKKELGLWSEVALNSVLEAGCVPFYACPVNGRWYEIDDLNDLAAAEALFI